MREPSLLVARRGKRGGGEREGGGGEAEIGRYSSV
jgi:hypothetical protein